MEGNILVNGVSTTPALDVDSSIVEGYSCLMTAVVGETPRSESRLENTCFATPAASEQMDESGEKISRHPRWTKEETLVLVDAKKKQEEDARELSMTGRAFTANEKWEFLQAFCKLRAVERDAQQCRKRWSNLYGEYKKIKDWHMQNRNENYWGLRRDRRKDSKLPGTFEFDIYAIMDAFISRRTGNTPGGTPGVASDTWRANEDDDEADDQEEYTGHAIGETGRADPGYCVPLSGSFREEQVDQVGHVDEVFGRRKKRRIEDTTLISVMESTGKALENTLLKSSQSQIDAYNRNSELDRMQRKCISDNLVGVLGKLADAIGKVAERL